MLTCIVITFLDGFLPSCFLFSAFSFFPDFWDIADDFFYLLQWVGRETSCFSLHWSAFYCLQCMFCLCVRFLSSSAYLSSALLISFGGSNILCRTILKALCWFFFVCSSGESYIAGARELRATPRRDCFLWDWRDHPGPSHSGCVFGDGEGTTQEVSSPPPVEAPGRGACWPWLRKAAWADWSQLAGMSFLQREHPRAEEPEWGGWEVIDPSWPSPSSHLDRWFRACQSQVWKFWAHELF